MKKTTEVAVSLLGTAEPAQLPVITKFLLETADNSPAEMENLLEEIKLKLLEFLQMCKTVQSKDVKLSLLNSQTLVMGILKQAFQSR